MRRFFLALFVVCSLLNATNTFGSEKRFTIVTESYPPYADPALENFGWTCEVILKAFESQKYHVKIRFLPWARAVIEVKKGLSNGLLNAFWTEERTKWAVFSKSFGEVKIGFFKLKTRKDIRYDGSLTALEGYKIGVGRGYATSEDFDNADFLDKHIFNNSIFCLKLLYRGGLDLVAGNKIVDFYNISKLGQKKEFKDMIRKIEFMEPALKVQKLHLAVSKASPDYLEMVKDFNRGLEQIMADGTYEKILKKHEVIAK